MPLELSCQALENPAFQKVLCLSLRPIEQPLSQRISFYFHQIVEDLEGWFGLGVYIFGSSNEPPE